MIVAIPPTFTVPYKNFASKTFRKKVRFVDSLSGRPSVPYQYRRPLYMAVTVDCHCCSIIYSSSMSNEEERKNGMMKIKKKTQSPVISFATFISFGPFWRT